VIEQNGMMVVAKLITSENIDLGVI